MSVHEHTTALKPYQTVCHSFDLKPAGVRLTWEEFYSMLVKWT